MGVQLFFMLDLILSFLIKATTSSGVAQVAPSGPALGGGVSAVRTSVLSTRAQALKNSYKNQFGRHFVAQTNTTEKRNEFTDPTPSYSTPSRSQHPYQGQFYAQGQTGASYATPSGNSSQSRYSSQSSNSGYSNSSHSKSERKKKSRWN